jgi:soluble lytic murein transglycosylase
MSGARTYRALLVAALAGVVACAGAPSEGQVPPRAAPPPAPSCLPSDAAASGDPASPDVVAETKLFATTVPPRPLDDPRLAPAREFLAKGKRIDAARAVEAVAESDAALGTRLQLLAATLRRDGGDPTGAMAAYRRVAAGSPLLAPAARLEIAGLQIAQGEHAAALATIASVSPEDRTSREWKLVVAEAEIRAGDASRGVSLVWELIAGEDRPRGWATSVLRIVQALLAKPGADRATAAATLARYLVDKSSGSVATEAYALEKRALDTLPRAARAEIVSPLGERIDAARAKARSKDVRPAVTLLDRMLKSDLAKASKKDACAIHRLRGEALGDVKRRAEAADAYGAAIALCSSIDLLFAAGRASARADRSAEAEARYAMVEERARADRDAAVRPDAESWCYQELPVAEAAKQGAGATHRLADDARVERVRAALERGDVTTATSLATTAGATYPNGDVVLDAPFLVAQSHMEKGEWDKARAVLEPARLAGRRERSYSRAGRFDYFLGRAHQASGRLQEAREAYAEAVRSRAGTYYGALAHARLEEMERGAGVLALAEARKRAMAAGPLPDPTSEELAAPWLRRAIELAVASDVASAEAEVAGPGLDVRRPSPGVRWWMARLVVPTDPIRASSLLRGASEVEPGPDDPGFDAWLHRGPFGPALPAWQIAYPRPFAIEVAAASTESGVGEPLLLSIMREESAFSPTALSRSGARGLLQLMPATARQMARPLSLPYDDDALQRPEINTRLGARFLGQLRKRFPTEPLLAVPSYNAGPLATERWCEERPTLDFDLWVETIPYRETRLYTKRVLASLAAYDLLGPGPRGEVFFTSRRACASPDGGGDRPGFSDEPVSEPSASSH